MNKELARRAEQPTAIAKMCASWTLDCVIEAALPIARDYANRHRQYSVPKDLSSILADLRIQTGADLFPNKEQRSSIYSPFLGSSDAGSPSYDTAFPNSAAAPRAAANAFSERAVDTGKRMVRQALVDAKRTSLVGSVINIGNQETEAIFNKAVNILRSAEVARAFGLTPVPQAPWPLRGKLDGNGAYLIEEIARTLQSTDLGTISERQFLALQQVADAGEKVITHVLSDGKSKDTCGSLNAEPIDVQLAPRDARAHIEDGP